MPIIQEFERLRQDYKEFKAILVYITKPSLKNERLTSTQETETGGSLKFEASSVYIVSSRTARVM